MANTVVIQRTGWVDIFKALAIILVVIGHTWSPFVNYIYAFHVPAFFFISGYTSNFKKYDLTTFINRKFKSFIIPYFTFNGIFVVIHYLLIKMNLAWFFYRPAQNATFGLLYNLNLLTTFSYTEEIGGATWFLVVLFGAQILSYMGFILISKRRGRDGYLFVYSLVCLAIAYLLFQRKFVPNYMIDLAFVASHFVILGYLAKRYLNLRHDKFPYLGIISFIVFFYYVQSQYTTLNFPTRTFGPVLGMLLGAFSGIIALCSISCILARYKWPSRILIYIGQRSLWIVALHFLAFKLGFLILSLMHIVKISQLREIVPLTVNNYWWFLSMIGILIPLSVEKLVNESNTFIISIFREKSDMSRVG